MENLIKIFREKFWNKPKPNNILKELGENKLKELSNRKNIDKDALWIGAYIADLFITEAIETGDITKHIPMALEYTERLFTQYPEINQKQREIITELIRTHHGGEQKHIESKIFKNADCFKFLEPKGVFCIFNDVYIEQNNFEKGLEYALFKLEEKYNLIDLNDELKTEAKELYKRWKWMFERIGTEYRTPDLYKK